MTLLKYGPHPVEIVLTVLAVGAVVGLYVLPTFIAAHRSVPNFGSVAVINLLLGWTLIGWAIALAMAVRDVPN